MPVGLVRKWTVVAIIAGVLGVIACKDEDEDPTPPQDAGNQGGTTGGGGLDAGSDSGGGTGGSDAGRDSGGGGVVYEAGAPCPGWDGGPLTCGTQECFWHRTPLTCSNPGCITPDGGSPLCAIDTTTLGGVDAGLPPFLPYNAPGVDSVACADLVDSFEDSGVGDGGTKGNHRIDVAPRMIMGLTIALSYEGCCTPAGYCSGNVGKGLAAIQGTGMANPSNAGYGCLDNRIFFSTSPAAQQIRCNAADGGLVAPSDGGATDSGGGGDTGAGDAGASDGSSGNS
jgi:hypothetical protein